MNQVSRHDRYEDEVARIREVVEQHPRPSFVTGVDVKLGEFDGDPAMWIIFSIQPKQDGTPADRLQRAQMLRGLRKSVQSDLLDRFELRFPYFRFVADRVAENAPH